MHKGKKTKILATLGPASANEEVLTAMVNSGLNAVRINTSHLTPDGARESFELARNIEQKTGVHIAVVFDLQGPKIRLDYVPNDAVEVAMGDSVTISVDDIPNNIKSNNPVTLNNIQTLKFSNRIAMIQSLFFLFWLLRFSSIFLVI